MVVDSVAGAVITTINVTGYHNDWTASGAYYAGRWYTQNWTNPIYSANATADGALTSTGLTPASVFSGMATDFADGVIYLAGYGDGYYGSELVRYDPVAGTLTNLATPPAGINDQSNIVLVR
jgi:hypothetical protein